MRPLGKVLKIIGIGIGASLAIVGIVFVLYLILMVAGTLLLAFPPLGALIIVALLAAL